MAAVPGGRRRTAASWRDGRGSTPRTPLPCPTPSSNHGRFRSVTPQVDSLELVPPPRAQPLVPASGLSTLQVTPAHSSTIWGVWRCLEALGDSRGPLGTIWGVWRCLEALGDS